MEECRKQGICSKFPFCDEEPKNCSKFTKRDYEMKLVSTDGKTFKFEKI